MQCGEQLKDAFYPTWTNSQQFEWMGATGQSVWLGWIGTIILLSNDVESGQQYELPTYLDNPELIVVLLPTYLYRNSSCSWLERA